jgi:predicted ester cyclase
MSDDPRETNKETATRLFLEVFDHKDLDAADGLLAPDVVFHNAGTDIVGIAGWKAWAAEWLTGFPDTRATVDFVMAEADRVLYHWRAEGTHTGEFRGRAATGRKIAASGLTLCRVVGGRVVEVWDETEAFGEFEALTVS